MSQPKIRFIIKKTIKGSFMFNMVSVNGKVMATGRGYNSKQACEKSILSIINNSADAEIIDTSLKTKKGKK